MHFCFAYMLEFRAQQHGYFLSNYGCIVQDYVAEHSGKFGRNKMGCLERWE